MGINNKLDARYSGPFRVLEYTKDHNYIVENLQHERVKVQFSIQRIKPVDTTNIANQETDNSIEYQIEII
jgi:hypothetical protein